MEKTIEEMRSLRAEIRIPNLDEMYNDVVKFVKDNQGEKGYIDCQPSLNGDIIYGFIYDDEERRGVENYVYAVRVVDDDLECLLEPVMNSYRVKYAPEDFTSEDREWYSVRWSDVYYIPTLFNIAESIGEYV